VFDAVDERILTAGSDHIARVWDARTRKELLRLNGHDGTVYRAAFSPDGAWIVTASHDRSARLWDATNGKQLLCLEHEEGLTDAAFSPDGRGLVTAFGNAACVWDASNGKELIRLVGHRGVVNGVAFSRDGKQVVTASLDWSIRVWDVSRVVSFPGNLAVCLAAALSQGNGILTDQQHEDLLFQEAPADLSSALRKQLPDREELIAQTFGKLAAPMHPNCYLSPTRFAEKFGLDTQDTASQGEATIEPKR